MTKPTINFSNLEQTISKKKVYKLADVQDKIEKVAFDVVRFVDSQDIDNLWQIQNCHDGDYIVAMYDDTLKSEASLKSDWQCLTSSSDVSVFYKGYPVAKLAAQDIGIPKEEINLVKRYLPNKLASDKGFANKMIVSYLSKDQRNDLYTKFPELV